MVNEAGLEITELSTHLQGQLVAVHPALYDLFDGFAPDNVKGKPKARTEWAVQQLKYAAKASQNLGLNAQQHLAAHCYGQLFILGHNDLLVC